MAATLVTSSSLFFGGAWTVFQETSNVPQVAINKTVNREREGPFTSQPGQRHPSSDSKKKYRILINKARRRFFDLTVRAVAARENEVLLDYRKNGL